MAIQVSHPLGQFRIGRLTPATWRALPPGARDAITAGVETYLKNLEAHILGLSAQLAHCDTEFQDFLAVQAIKH